MKRATLLDLIVFVMCLGSTLATFGQTTAGSMLFAPTANLSSSSQNGHTGSAGGVFLTTYSLWPNVNWLGYYDKDGDGLVNSHEVSLWYTGGANGDAALEVAHATVPAGTTAPLYNGYRWVQLPSTVGLWYGSWYTIAAQTDGVDTWGDLISGSQLTWNTDYIGNNDGSWSRAGRYDSTASWPGAPVNQVGSDAIYPAANMGYNLPIVPEPTSLSLIAMGSLGVLAWVRRARKQ